MTQNPRSSTLSRLERVKSAILFAVSAFALYAVLHLVVPQPFRQSVENAMATFALDHVDSPARAHHLSENLVVLAPREDSTVGVPRASAPSEMWRTALQALNDSPARAILIAEWKSDTQWKNMRLKTLDSRFVFSSRVLRIDEAKESNTFLKMGKIKSQLSKESALTDTSGSTELNSGLHIVGSHTSFGKQMSYGHIGPFKPWLIQPVYETDSDGEWHWSKHLGLSWGAPVQSEGGRLLIGSREVPQVEEGHILVPPARRIDVARATIDFDQFALQPEAFVGRFSEKTIVIVQEHKQQAASQSLQTEISQLASLVSRHESGEWTRTFRGYSWFLSLLFGALMLAVALLTPALFLGIALPCLSAYVLAAPMVFAQFDLVMPWLDVTFVLIPSAVIAGFRGWHRQGLARAELSAFFRHTVRADTQVSLLERAPAGDGEEAYERVVTLMDVDVVGFAKTIENSAPDETGPQLSQILTELIAIVHRYNGFVSEVSPDGLLVAFGHGFNPSGAASPAGKQGLNHAADALLCARELQLYSVSRIHSYTSTALPPFPVRISLCSCTVRFVFLEIMGSLQARIVGAGVDTARQLAAHCEPFRILASTSTMEILTASESQKPKKWSTPRHVKFSDSRDWFAAFEFNPFDHDPELLKQAHEIYRSYNKIKREDTRLAFPRGAEPGLASEVGAFEVLDFSETGLRLRAKNYFSSGTMFKLWPAEQDESSAAFRAGVIVQWGAPSARAKDQFILGVRYSALTETEREQILHHFHMRLEQATRANGQQAS